jgi:hypothetical protein
VDQLVYECSLNFLFLQWYERQWMQTVYFHHWDMAFEIITICVTEAKNRLFKLGHYCWLVIVMVIIRIKCNNLLKFMQMGPAKCQSEHENQKSSRFQMRRTQDIATRFWQRRRQPRRRRQIDSAAVRVLRVQHANRLADAKARLAEAMEATEMAEEAERRRRGRGVRGRRWPRWKINRPPK